MSISTLKESDFATWSELWRKYLLHDGITNMPEQQYQGSFARIIDENGDIYGLVVRDPEDPTKILGLSHFVLQPSVRTEKPYAHMSDLFVDASARRKGYGRKLIMATAEAASQMGCSRLSWIMEKNNEEAKKLYEMVAGPSTHDLYRMPL
ncbi:acyl-CoA N-acyltransferase [Lophiotrema nucula]|uniref:Acyl-CoA N-acyltransferase n=1 Tax=Lophiotrema nucula TaxID=690887 RepID=A0A6A5YHD2_9PLEO|nr:acyl-CoA N-acyltransferase [Lophiotrema nucula]